MVVYYLYRGETFVRDGLKALEKRAKHGVRFETACEVFFDRLSQSSDATVDDESRTAVLGADASERGDTMRTARLRMREQMTQDRVMTSISLRIPEHVVEDMKEIAPMLGFSGYQSLIKAYISQGLRKDLEKLEGSQVVAITESLRKQGVPDEKISAAIAEAGLKTA